MSPRLPTERELALLALILSADFTGAQELRVQVPNVVVVGPWAEGSPSIDLRVMGDAVRARGVPSPVPVGATVVGEAGELVGELLVWLDDGLLAGLEFAWYTDEMPSALPTLDRVRLEGDASPRG